LTHVHRPAAGARHLFSSRALYGRYSLNWCSMRWPTPGILRMSSHAGTARTPCTAGTPGTRRPFADRLHIPLVIQHDAGNATGHQERHRQLQRADFDGVWFDETTKRTRQPIVISASGIRCQTSSMCSSSTNSTPRAKRAEAEHRREHPAQRCHLGGFGLHGISVRSDRREGPRAT
jgi:hypothetical protein